MYPCISHRHDLISTALLRVSQNLILKKKFKHGFGKGFGLDMSQNIHNNCAETNITYCVPS